MHITINKNSSIPVYLQIKNSIRDMILTGELGEGFLLPPERKLAEKLEVSRSTVINAYEELKADGLIKAHIGKGTRVLPRVFENNKEIDKEVLPLSWYQFFNESNTYIDERIFADVMDISGYNNIISFASGVPAPGLYPLDEIKQIQNKLWKTSGENMLNHSPIEGYYPLRESISSLLKYRKIYVPPKEIMILSGSMQGLDFASRVFVSPGDIVIVEEPTFLGMLQLLRISGAKVIGVPVDKDGMRTDILESLLFRYKPKFIYTLPTFQNPSGTTMSMERRQHLLELAYRYQIPIIEDDPYGDLRYEGIFVPSLKSLDKYGYVIYISTFSKVMFSGLRIGWIAAPTHVIKKFSLMKQMTDLHVNTPGQCLLDSFIREEYYENHLNKVREEYKRKRNIMVKALEENSISGVSWNIPEGGYYIWCCLPDNITHTRLIAKASSHGVIYAPGYAFYPDGSQGEKYMRLNFTYPSNNEIEDGINKLMKAVSETVGEASKSAVYAGYNKQPIV